MTHIWEHDVRSVGERVRGRRRPLVGGASLEGGDGRLGARGGEEVAHLRRQHLSLSICDQEDSRDTTASSDPE